MSDDERMDSPKNLLALLGVFLFAVFVNPLVKLKDWLTGERE